MGDKRKSVTIVPTWEPGGFTPRQRSGGSRSAGRAVSTSGAFAIDLAAHLEKVTELSKSIPRAGSKKQQMDLYLERALAHRRAGSWYAATSDYTSAHNLQRKLEDAQDASAPSGEAAELRPNLSEDSRPQWMPRGARHSTVGLRKGGNAEPLATQLSNLNGEQRLRLQEAVGNGRGQAGGGPGKPQRHAAAAALITRLLGGGSVTVFASLDPAPLLELCTLAAGWQVDPNHRVVNEGDVGDSFYVVLDGTLAVQRAGGSGGDVTLTTLRPGNHFGDLALISSAAGPGNEGGGRRSATVRSLTPCLLLQFMAEDFQRLLSHERQRWLRERIDWLSLTALCDKARLLRPRTARTPQWNAPVSARLHARGSQSGSRLTLPRA